jgi:hypothetical protein
MIQDGDITVRLQAPPHVSVGFTELYVNGEAQHLVVDDAGVRIDPSGVLSISSVKGVQRLDGLPTDRGDLVVIAVSKNGNGLAPTGGGGVFCYSAPLYVDTNGDGLFTGWLEDTQQVR